MQCWHLPNSIFPMRTGFESFREFHSSFTLFTNKTMEYMIYDIRYKICYMRWSIGTMGYEKQDRRRNRGL